MNDMTLSEIAKLKRNTEADIASIIQDFMTTTGLPVNAIRIELCRTVTSSYIWHPRDCTTLTEVSLEVDLNNCLAMCRCVEEKQ